MYADLIPRIEKTDRIAVSRAITIVENGLDGDRDLLSALFNRTGRAYRIGITGPPGAGKSSLTDKLIQLYRNTGLKVAVIGVDPTSPFTGGALLGDRIRMSAHSGDDGVFIRSMASRGGHGGLSRKTQEAGDIFDAAGYDVILLETVGVGQVELDVVQAADSVIVVLVPESGDEIQMMKAGLMEIGDIFVVNKSDREGANKLLVTLQHLLAVREGGNDTWSPQVTSTIASTGSGIDRLGEIIEHHRTHLETTGRWERKLRERYISQVRELVQDELTDQFWNESKKQQLQDELSKHWNIRTSPYQLSQLLLAQF